MIRDLGNRAPSVDQLLRHAAWTRQLARSLVSDAALADDIGQETLVSALRHPPDTTQPLKPWLRTVVSHHAYNQARERKRREAREQGSAAPQAAQASDELLDRLELHKVLVEAVSQLAEPYRQMVLLRYFEELSSSEIGARENLPAGTVRGRLKTAVELLREALDARYGARALWVAPFSTLSQPPTSTAGAPAAGKSTPPGRPRISARGAQLVGVTSIVAAVVATTWWVARDPHEKTRRPNDLGHATQAGGGDPRDPLRATSAYPGASSPLHPTPGDSSSSPRAATAGSLWLAGTVTVGEDAARKLRHLRRVGPLGGLADVVIRIVKGASRPAAQLTGPGELTSKDLRVPPAIRIVEAGQSLVFENADAAAHLLRVSRGATPLFEQPVEGHARSPVLTIPSGLEPVRLEVRERPEEAVIVVPTDNPFHGVTRDDGRFVVDGLPPGTYTIEAWDEDLGILTQEVVIPAPAASSLHFSFGEGAHATTDGSCNVAVPGRGPVGEACQAGGRAKARAFMKVLVKQARAKGEKHTCDQCHRDLDTYKLLDSARDDLETLLSFVGAR